MAKIKRKEGVWGYEVALQEDGTTTWVTGEHIWEWFPFNGLNLFRVQGNGEKDGVAHFKTLKEAMFFTIGFYHGFRLAALVGETGDTSRRRPGPSGA